MKRLSASKVSVYEEAEATNQKSESNESYGSVIHNNQCHKDGIDNDMCPKNTCFRAFARHSYNACFVEENWTQRADLKNPKSYFLRTLLSCEPDVFHTRHFQLKYSTAAHLKQDKRNRVLNRMDQLLTTHKDMRL